MPSAQLAAIIADLERHKTIFDADVVGDQVLTIQADECSRRFDTQEDPDGNPWPPLSDAYAAWKADHALNPDMGYLYFTMSTDDNFAGERGIFKDQAWWTFGVNEKARDEAAWFEEGDPGKNRPPRPFTAMSDIAIQLIDDFLDKHYAASM